MAASLASLEKGLKTLFLGAIIEEMNTKVDPFAARIARSTQAIVGNNGIERAAQIGLNGGFGAGTETGTLPLPGENIYKRLRSTTKNLYGTIAVSDKLLRSVKGNDAGSYADLVEREVKGMLETARWQFGRQIYGSASGKLANCTAGAASTKIGVDSVQFLIEGMTIDLVNSAGTVVESARRITDVNRDKLEITISGTAVTVPEGAYLTIQGSKGLEMTGLADLFDTSAATLYENTRADNSWLNPYVKTDAGAITQSMILDAIIKCEDAYNVNINYINAGNNAFDHYMNLLVNERRQVNTDTLVGGARALKFNGIDVVRNRFAPADGMDFLDTSKFVIDQVNEWDWIEGPTRSIFVQNGNTPTYNATLVKYADLMCVTPGGMARLTGITAPVEAAV